MRLLVIGSTGQLARALAERGETSGFDVIRAGRPQIDLAQPEGLSDLIGQVAPDAIINAAAYTAVDQAEDEEDLARAINRDGPAALARAARARSLPFLHVSTDYVFSGRKSDGAGAPYAENAPTDPVNAYGRTKAEGEAAVLTANPSALVVRTSWVYAPWGTNFVQTMLRLSAERDSLNVVSDQTGRPTEANALASGLVELAQALRGGAPGGLLHLTNQGEASWHDLALAAIRGAGRDTAVEPIPTSAWPTRAPRPGDTRLALEKAERDYGVSLPDWRESLAVCLERIGAGGRAG